MTIAIRYILTLIGILKNGKMKSITLIAVGRDDGFAEDFITRIKTSVSTNIKFLEKNKIEFEYIIVDWSPLDKKYLHCNNEIKDIFSDTRIQNIVVDEGVVLNEKLNPKLFYEYFAKNIGIRAAKNDYVLLTNADIIIPQQIWSGIKDILEDKEINIENFFRPTERWNVEVKDYKDIVVKDTHILREPGLPDECICGGFSGDFLFISRDVLINKGCGYNEEDISHRQQDRWQTGMDGEILWNLHNNGVKLKFFESPYYHISHSGIAPQVSWGRKLLDGAYKMNAHYKNKPNWGFIDYTSSKQNNTTFITYGVNT